jgi:hypothetical protein
MRLITIISIFVLLIIKSYGQIDSFKMDAPAYKLNYYDSKINDYANSRLFTLGSELSYEARVYKKLSFKLGYEISQIKPFLNKSNPIVDRNMNQFGFGIGLRYYFFKSPTHDGKTNLTGLYTGLGLGRMLGLRIQEDGVKKQNFPLLSVLTLKHLEVGVQARIYNRLYCGIGARLSYGSGIIANSNADGIKDRIDIPNQFYFLPFLRFGLAFGNEKKEDNPDNFVDYSIYKNRLIKISFSQSLYNPLFGDGYFISYERKLGKGNFTIIPSIGLRDSKRKYFDEEGDFKKVIRKEETSTTTIGLEQRYYHDAEKRKLKGKYGNGFSANYISLDAQLLIESIEDVTNKVETSDLKLVLAPYFGLQREIGNDLFIDFGFKIIDFQYIHSTEKSRFDIFNPGIRLNFGGSY